MMPDSLKLAQPLPAEVTAIRLLDASGEEVKLDTLLSKGSTLIILLRHFGCIACCEHVNAWLPHLERFTACGIQLYFVGNGQPRYLEGFVERHQLSGKPITVLTDPQRSLYDAVGMVRSITSNLRPTSIKNAIRAFTRGNRQTAIEGNPNQQGGILFFDKQRNLVFVHRERTLGDHLPVDTVYNKVVETLNLNR